MSRKARWYADTPLDWIIPLLMIIAATIVYVAVHYHRLNEVTK